MIAILCVVVGFLVGWYGTRRVYLREVQDLQMVVYGLEANAEQDQRDIRRMRAW